ncbi:multidrug resistance protein [Scytonema hofmannii FACHB-248]|uniref:Multidrug resistance protein n=1 Tax=Scytonema hofmannii FACHB-248 TaxID=1842502 RepID=A0ABR8GTU6_9CYAN|nr:MULTISPECIES: EamA family transporter [Nostocales]MBD2606896.1 multidrug resistance protein [Scytonema hofmannii FACHB-248]
MSLNYWLILMLVVVLGTIAQLSLKYALKGSSSDKKTMSVLNILFSLYFWIWFICYTVMTVMWLLVLRAVPLNQAYPFLGLTYAFVPLASHYFLQEKVVFSQWFGIGIIVGGIVLVVQT